MSKLLINGGRKLNGVVEVQGAKNSVLPILAATVICEDKCVIHNCPNLSDVNVSFEILKLLGSECWYGDSTSVIDSGNISGYEIPKNLMCEMRSSVIFLGAILSRFGKAVISNPGGCDLGPRPIDIHLEALKNMGVNIESDDQKIFCSVSDRLQGAEISLSFASVGATENTMLAAVKAKGRTIIHNAAREPEIVDLACFLNKCGARITGAGSTTVIIEGVSKLNGATHSVISDRIVTATYLSAVAAAGGKAVFKSVCPEHSEEVIKILSKMGCDIFPGKNEIGIVSTGRLNSIKFLETGVYPAFPTDAGPMMVALMTAADGKSVFKENIFSNRFNYVIELQNMGADIDVKDNTAFINGNKNLSGCNLYCTDLRAGAALAIAALAAKGKSTLEGISYIDRGYESIEIVFSELGADIKRI